MKTKTAEEIINPVLCWADLEGDVWEDASRGDIIKAMESYATQQVNAATEELKKRCEELEAKLKQQNEPEPYEPYFGWCNVDGCHFEGCSGGIAWKETGYWTVCQKHSQDAREGKPAPPMKKEAIEREKSRNENGYVTKDIYVPE